MPSGLTEDDMILPSLMTRRVPIGLMYWSLEMTWPWSVVWPTWSVPNWWVSARATPVPAATTSSGRGGRDEVRPAAFASTEKAETVLLVTPTACYLH